jgi:hypothetical protein
MAKIVPVIFPLNLGEVTDLKVKAAQLDMEATTCMIHFQLISETATGYPNNNYPYMSLTERVLGSGTLLMDTESYNQWGSDNMYVIQWVANKLGVTLIE